MDGQYCETYVKRGVLTKHKVIRALIWLVALAAFVAGWLLIGPYGFIPCIVIVLVGVFISPSFNVDYEYVYVDGQIDFDRITSGEKRKTMLRLDLDGIEMMAPLSSHRLDSFKNAQGLVKHDFSSQKPDAVLYGIAYTEGDKRNLVVFEPGEEMLALATRKSPRKVFKD
ncbi:MAG: hypothetical protein J5739_00425 [Lachnospiraceae bacterium]|nr:hypothetical protein [Lachnospiraceae bacterium]